MSVNQEFPFHSIGTEKVYEKTQSSNKGLTEEEVRERIEEYGENKLPEKNKTSPLILFLKQFKDFLVLILAVAAIIAYFADHMVDVYVIVGVIIINAFIGFIQEYKAEKAIRGLKDMLSHESLVLRNGKKIKVGIEKIVPGDVIILEEGKSVPADARIVEEKNLQVVESSLTGESMPVEKITKALDEKTSLADRKNMIFKGTHIARGSCKAIVTATGVHTELGKIAESLKKEEKRESNFKKKTNTLAKIMAVIAISTAAVVFLLGYFVRNFEFEEILLVTIATLVSSIPEGLPAVLSIVLAIGANRMARRNAIIRAFTATEMAGSVSVVLTDKTGTISQSVLTVKKFFLANGKEYDIEGSGYNVKGNIQSGDENTEEEERFLNKVALISSYCNNATIQNKESSDERDISGDPTEISVRIFSEKLKDYLVPLRKQLFQSRKFRIILNNVNISHCFLANFFY